MSYHDNRRKRRSEWHNRDSWKKRKPIKPEAAENPKLSIVNKVQAQKGIRGQLVLYQSNYDHPYTVLQNAVDRVNSTIVVQQISEAQTGKTFQLKINNEILGESTFINQAEAKKGLAELAFKELQKTCFTIFRKTHPRDSPQVDLASSSSSEAKLSPNVSSEVVSTSTSSASSIGGIGAKMMAQMGWSGGGLGAQEQGRINIVQPYIQIRRQGLGSQNITQEVKKILQEYADSRDINSIAFTSDFTKEERVIIHEVARKLNLKSRSYGKEPDRLLVVQSKARPWDLVYSLLESGGETDQLKLIHPTNFSSQ